MSLTIGIVGLPNVGKSTLFNALTQSNQALAENYPFATIDANVGIVDIPDKRLVVLAKMFNSKKIVPATVSFVDIAGLVKGANKGEGLGNKFLSNIREANAICQVVRAFENNNITHVDGNVDPKRDIETINTELILADIETINNAVIRYKKEVASKKISKSVLDVAEKAQLLLNSGELLFTHKNEDWAKIAELGLLTTKIQIYIFNVDTQTLKDVNKQNELKLLVPNSNDCVFINAELEAELVGLSSEDAIELLEAETGSKTTGLNALAKRGFDVLGLQTFFTAGEIEAKAWEIKKGWTAPKAAGVIHTDFEKGFIKAQVISYEDLIAAQSMHRAWELGKVRIEGKDYIMQESDIVEFRFNK
jgi:GTP-binding protein YchF